MNDLHRRTMWGQAPKPRPNGDVVTLSDWRAGHQGGSEAVDARLHREAEAKRRAELLFRRRRLSWWRRLGLAFLDLFGRGQTGGRR